MENLRETRINETRVEGREREREKIPYRSHGYWTDSLSPNSLMFRRITGKEGEESMPRNRLFFLFFFHFYPTLNVHPPRIMAEEFREITFHSPYFP